MLLRRLFFLIIFWVGCTAFLVFRWSPPSTCGSLFRDRNLSQSSRLVKESQLLQYWIASDEAFAMTKALRRFRKPSATSYRAASSPVLRV